MFFFPFGVFVKDSFCVDLFNICVYNRVRHSRKDLSVVHFALCYKTQMFLSFFLKHECFSSFTFEFLLIIRRILCFCQGTQKIFSSPFSLCFTNFFFVS